MDLSLISQIPIWIKIMFSLKANGTSMDCLIEKTERPGLFHLTLFVFPGRKETLFTKLNIPHCDISFADWDLSSNPSTLKHYFIPKGSFRKESLDVFIHRPSFKINPEPSEYHFIVKPLKPKGEIDISLSYGGWFQTISSRHYLTC